jgi:hypothetical protein
MCNETGAALQNLLKLLERIVDDPTFGIPAIPDRTWNGVMYKPAIASRTMIIY